MIRLYIVTALGGNIMKLKINSIISITEYLFLFFIILDCNTVYSLSLKDYHFPEIIVGLCIILLLENGVLKKSIILRKWISFFLIYGVLMLFFLFISVPSNSLVTFSARYFVFLPFCFLLILIYINKGKIYPFLSKIVNIMTIFAAVSLFFWIFGTQLHFISPSGYVTAIWGGEVSYPSYYGLYFEMQGISFFSYKGLRNQGIFSEGPMYSLCLCISLALDFFICQSDSLDDINEPDGFFYKRKHIIHSRVKKVLLIVALITTITTTGYILLSFMLVMNYYIQRPKRRFARICKYLFGGIVAFVGLTVIYRVFLERAMTNSWLVRIDDFRAGFKAWQVAPIFGNGYNVADTILSFSSFRGNQFGFSNSIAIILAQGGLVLFSVYIIPLLGCLIKVLKAHEMQFAMFVAVFCVEFIFTIFIGTFLMLFFISFFYGIIFSKKKCKKISDRIKSYNCSIKCIVNIY